MKKRLFSLFLCVCLLASCAVLFSSCAKKTIDFSNGYTVVYGSDMSELFVKDVKAFAATLKAKTATDVSAKQVKSGDDLSDDTDYEILVGNTNRPETEKVLRKIKGQGYAIKMVGKKLVIVGTTNFLTNIAMEQFVTTYLSGTDSISKLSFEKVEKSEMEMIEITTKTNFVYSSYLLGEGDYVVDKIQSMKTNISSISNVRGTGMNMINDTMSAKSEILIGVVNREETKTLLASMDAQNYAVAAKNGKLLVTAFNDTVLASAFDLFNSILSDSVYVNEEEEKQLLLPADFTRIYSVDKGFVTDFPRPEGLALSGTIDVHDGDLQYYYGGEAANTNAYEKYCSDLVKAGYKLYLDHTAEGNIYRTYTNETANIMLYVSYNAYEYAEKQLVEGVEKGIRVIASALDTSHLLDEELLAPDLSYERLQNAAVTVVRLDYGDDSSAGQLEIMTLEDGSFIIIDGGNRKVKDTERIWNILFDLYMKGHNDMRPTTENPIRVAAWICTHSHGDHIGSTIDFINTYCTKYNSGYPVTIDRLIANFPSDEGYYNCYRDKTANATVRDNWAEYSALIKDAPGEEPGMEYIKVRTGQKFWLANVEFEVLFTHEDHYPLRVSAYNDTCTVIRSTIHHTENGVISTGSSTKVLWLGDAWDQSAQLMRASFGSYLQSDIVQMSHHGTGADWKLYALTKPKCVIVPNQKTAFVSALSNTNSLMYKVSNDLKTVEYVIVSDVANYTLSITKSGANYAVGGRTGVFSAGDNVTVTLGSVNAITNTCYFKTKYCQG